MRLLKIFLIPFSCLYFVITSIRNFLYDFDILKSRSYDIKIICVGNLSVGGTGKTPMIEHLIDIYKDKFKIAVLSRGYKRSTKGFVEVSKTMTAREVGDEPLQFKKKYDSIGVFVDADRRNGIENIQKFQPQTQLILLDDAYQHRRVKAHRHILLTTHDQPFYRDFILPFGRLREPRKGKKRADLIIVTKCPDKLSKEEKLMIKQNINPRVHQEVLFSKIKYSSNVESQKKTIALDKFDDFYLITGIANPKPLIGYLKQNKKSFEHLKYPDHHKFISKEISYFKNLKKPILTTEKDYMRLFDKLDTNVFYLPIQIEVDQSIEKHLNI